MPKIIMKHMKSEWTKRGPGIHLLIPDSIHIKIADADETTYACLLKAIQSDNSKIGYFERNTSIYGTYNEAPHQVMNDLALHEIQIPLMDKNALKVLRDFINADSTRVVHVLPSSDELSEILIKAGIIKSKAASRPDPVVAPPAPQPITPPLAKKQSSVSVGSILGFFVGGWITRTWQGAVCGTAIGAGIGKGADAYNESATNNSLKR